MSESESAPPPGVDAAVVLERDSCRLETIMPVVEQFLASQWLKTPAYGCILIGGGSTRMGRPKHQLAAAGLTGAGLASWFGLVCIALGLGALLVMSLAGAIMLSAPAFLLCGLALGGAVTVAADSVMERRRKRRCPWTALGDGMSAGLIFIDENRGYVYANRATEGFPGLPAGELSGRPVGAVMHALRMPLLLAMDVLHHGSRPIITCRFPMNGRTVAVEFSRSRSADGE